MLLSNRALIGSNPEDLYAFTNSVTTEWALGTNRSNWNKNGMLRNFHCGDANVPGVAAAASAALGGDMALFVFTDTTHGSGSFAPGQILTGVGVAEGTRITAFVTGTGSNNGGTYTINISQTITAQTITGTNPSLTTQASRPAGNTHPVAYVMAQKPGRVSSHKICYVELDGNALASIGSLIFTSACVVSVDGAATGTLIIGSLIDGTVALVIDASAVGIMSLGGEGTADITVTSTGAILGHVPAAGTTTIQIGAIVSAVALGWLAGNGPIEIDGTLDPYAVGWLEGTTAEAGLTNVGIANSVWNAIAASLNAPGSMGEKMNAAGAAGDPWLTPLPGGYVPGTAGDIIGNQVPDIKTLATFLSNIEGGKWKIIGNQMIFYKADNVTEVARFNLYNAAGAPSMTEVYERRRA